MGKDKEPRSLTKAFRNYLNENRDIEKVVKEEGMFEESLAKIELDFQKGVIKLCNKEINHQEFNDLIDRLINQVNENYPDETVVLEELEEIKRFPMVYIKLMKNQILEEEIEENEEEFTLKFHKVLMKDFMKKFRPDGYANFRVKDLQTDKVVFSTKVTQVICDFCNEDISDHEYLYMDELESYVYCEECKEKLLKI